MSKRESSIFMERTVISPLRTVSEIGQELIKAGARQIATEFGVDRKPVALRWQMEVEDGRQLIFEMPARVDRLLLVMRKRAPLAPADALLAKAERVAWRQLLRWVQAQNALLETGMVKPQQVFFAYWLPTGRKSIYEMVEAAQFKALPAPEEPIV
jgi:hypothetical protein